MPHKALLSGGWILVDEAIMSHPDQSGCVCSFRRSAQGRDHNLIVWNEEHDSNDTASAPEELYRVEEGRGEPRR